jgi:hypothetical protein
VGANEWRADQFHRVTDFLIVLNVSLVLNFDPLFILPRLRLNIVVVFPLGTSPEPPSARSWLLDP